jgi:ribonuclease P protein component
VSRNADQHDLNGRVAFIAGKKLGGAVWRNRAKRRMRGLCNDIGGPFPNWDVVFIARKGIEGVPYDEMKSQILNALNKARIVKK